MEGRKPKKVTVTKSKLKRTTKGTSLTRSKPKAASKRQPMLVVKKRPTKKTAKQKQKSAKSVVTALPATPMIASSLVKPLQVQPIGVTTAQQKTPVHPWSLSHNLLIVVSLVLTAVIAMTMIAGFTQTTLQQIEALESSSTSLMKPTATETRFYTTTAGELTLTLPITWAVTDTVENRTTYSHTTLADTTITVQVDMNDTDNVFTWLQSHEPSYTNATVLASTETVSALRGVTVAASTTDGVPLQVIYLPIQKNLGERYVISIQAVMPAGSATAAKEALENITTNLEVK